MNLQAKLDHMREQFEATAPAEALAIMHRATETLLRSAIMENVLKVGERAPDFALNDQDGKPIKSKALLAQGPLVVSFYRGAW